AVGGENGRKKTPPRQPGKVAKKKILQGRLARASPRDRAAIAAHAGKPKRVNFFQRSFAGRHIGQLDAGTAGTALSHLFGHRQAPLTKFPLPLGEEARSAARARFLNRSSHFTEQALSDYSPPNQSHHP